MRQYTPAAMPLSSTSTSAAGSKAFVKDHRLEKFALCVWLANIKNSPPAASRLNSFALPVLAAGQLPIGYLLAAIGLLLVAYVAKAAIDNLTHQAGNSVFERWGKWFDARVSWLNKYQPGN